ncbi:hypothetical protein GCM10010507_19320 [Streptomyces cinnamoneus]|uniref:eCIS core domain-containing protein n=1 Tax=Streptomyces cinnamoneus TaxID=53446 RepID=A0A918TDF6_STRCJ|nr:hypothetical protein GCM10010507_19320 [Streptomyces cinnamoneus]
MGLTAGRGRPRRPGPARARAAAAGALGPLQAAGNAAVARMLRERYRGGPLHDGSAVRNVLRTAGRPLEQGVRQEMEERFGADFSTVRVHRDAAAQHSAASLGARAYTAGEHVVLGRDGDDKDDKRVLAHELAHVLQQRLGAHRPAGTDGEVWVGEPGDRWERAAEADAQRVLRGSGGLRAVPGTADAPPARPATHGSVTVQRLLDHNRQNGTGFGSMLGRDGRVEAAWIRTDGTLTGQAPMVDPPGYAYIRRLRLANFWIRFHLINEKAGGKGTADNLVPASKRDNSRYHADIEQGLKEDVEDVREKNRKKKGRGEVFFGVEVDYPAAPLAGTGTAAQLAHAEFFPKSLRVFSEVRDPGSGRWTERQRGKRFAFLDGQPADPGTSAALSGLTRDTLKTLVPVRREWTDDEVSFLRALGGARKGEFEELIDKHSGAGPVESLEAAFEEIPVSAPATTRSRSGRAVKLPRVSFAHRIGNDKVIKALSEAIAHGVLTL